MDERHNKNYLSQEVDPLYGICGLSTQAYKAHNLYI